MDRQSIENDIAFFADIATRPHLYETSGGFVLEIVQSGEQVVLSFVNDLGDGVITERRDGRETKYSNFRSLLASTSFGGVQHLARVQAEALRERFENHEFLEINGDIITQAGTRPISVTAVDDAISERADSPLTALLLDGPAGIGKTYLIERLVYQRASAYRLGNRPPILHVQSRGRVMTWLPDRIASTLQDFRSLRLTYEQLPILVRHGLVEVAIDGFDELADPAGYEHSWASLRAFVEKCVGSGAILLAGRDTFLGAERLRRALIKVDERNLIVARLRSVSPGDARQWLRRRGWTTTLLKLADEWALFDESSYALRPYFLAQLAQLALEETDFEAFAKYPLAFLIQLIVRREAKKLGGVIELIVSDQALETATWAFYQEVARTMADYETDVLDIGTLQLMANVAFESSLHGDDLQRIRYRVESIALLERANGDARRLAHSEIQNFFLSRSLLAIVARSEIPKSIMRNVFGSDLLRTFCFTVSATNDEEAKAFLNRASSLLRGRPSEDRTARNLGSLIFAASPKADVIKDLRLEAVSLDDVVVEGVTGVLYVLFVSINQLDARGANLANMVFRDSQVASLLADETTVLPRDFPIPSFVDTIENGRQKQLYNESDIRAWLLRRQTKVAEFDRAVGVGSVHHPLITLIERACRVMLRQYWIRPSADDVAGRLVAEAEWPHFEKLLVRHDLLRKEYKAPAGAGSDFYHIKRPRDILARLDSDSQVGAFWRDVKNAISAPAPPPPLRKPRKEK